MWRRSDDSRIAGPLVVDHDLRTFGRALDVERAYLRLELRDAPLRVVFVLRADARHLHEVFEVNERFDRVLQELFAPRQVEEHVRPLEHRSRLREFQTRFVVVARVVKLEAFIEALLRFFFFDVHLRERVRAEQKDGEANEEGLQAHVTRRMILASMPLATKPTHVISGQEGHG